MYEFSISEQSIENNDTLQQNMSILGFYLHDTHLKWGKMKSWEREKERERESEWKSEW